MRKTKLLLHVCCAPCGAHVAELLNRDFNVSGYYYNPNIQPAEEYQKRLAAVEQFFEQKNIPLMVGSYEPDQWFKIIKGLEKVPEGGARCRLCYLMRLEETAKKALQKDFDVIATTLTVSPHKKAEVINQLGRELADKYQIKFYEADFKKQDGFKKASQLAKEECFYRQSYCGCLFSQRA